MRTWCCSSLPEVVIHRARCVGASDHHRKASKVAPTGSDHAKRGFFVCLMGMRMGGWTPRGPRKISHFVCFTPPRTPSRGQKFSGLVYRPRPASPSFSLALRIGAQATTHRLPLTEILGLGVKSTKFSFPRTSFWGTRRHVHPPVDRKFQALFTAYGPPDLHFRSHVVGGWHNENYIRRR